MMNALLTALHNLSIHSVKYLIYHILLSSASSFMLCSAKVYITIEPFFSKLEYGIMSKDVHAHFGTITAVTHC